MYGDQLLADRCHIVLNQAIKSRLVINCAVCRKLIRGVWWACIHVTTSVYNVKQFCLCFRLCFFLNSLADLGQKRVPDGWHAGTKGFHWQRYTVSSNDRKLREGDSEKSQMTLSADEACVLYGDSTLKKILLSLHKCQHPVATQEIIRMGLFRMVTAKSRHTWGSQRNL